MTLDIMLTYGVLLLAIFLFVTEKLRTDLVAVLIMVLLPWTGVITVDQAFSGFASNAVISVMAVMLIGYGVDRSGVMAVVAKFIMEKVGKKEKNIRAATSATVGIISSFMQNIGAAALFLPALRNIGKRANIPASKLILPMGFAAILGGTLTMVASGPLIILNDLLVDSGQEAFHLFSVTPIGLALLASGVLYFYFFGNLVLPKAKGAEELSPSKQVQDTYDLTGNMAEVTITESSSLIDQSIEEADLWSTFNLNVLAIEEDGSKIYSPWRKTHFRSGQSVVLLGHDEDINRFVETYELQLKPSLQKFSNLENEDQAGFAELIIPPKSPMIGQTFAEIGFRKTYKIEPISFITSDGERQEVSEKPLEAGTTMVVFGRWEDIDRLKSSREFAVITEVTAPLPDQKRDMKIPALFSLAVSLTFVLLGVQLSLSFFTGAMLMILLGVIPKKEIYPAIDWKTVFLLAGLIPMGTAFEQSGAAELTAGVIIDVVGGWGTLGILFVIGIISMLFSLFMSNVAATVLLVPLVIMMGESFGIDPRGLALLVAISASNSFLLPTHQVNAFTMGPGGYRNADYMRAGSIMSFIFLIVSVLMTYVMFV